MTLKEQGNLDTDIHRRALPMKTQRPQEEGYMTTEVEFGVTQL